MTHTLAKFPTKCNSLNFIRLVLAVLVIVSHSWAIGRFGKEPHFGQFSLGGFAVAGFFTLSGWLITQSRMSSELPSYLWRRFCRVYPGYLVALLVVGFVFAPIGSAVSSGDYHLSNGFGYVMKNVTLNIRDYTVGSSLPSWSWPAWNGSLWSLRYEVACYIVIGLVLTTVGRRWLKATSISGLAGLTIAFLIWQAAGPRGMTFVPEFLGLAPFFFAGAVLFAFRDQVPLRGIYAATSVAFAIFVVWTGVTPTLAAIPIAYFLLWLGATLPAIFQRIGRENDLSYGAYIYAFPVQQLLALIGAAKFGVVFYIAVSVVSTLPLAAASWFAVERPANRWRHAFDRFPLVRNGYGIKRRPESITPYPASSAEVLQK